jgi:hypothetical protein
MNHLNSTLLEGIVLCISPEIEGENPVAWVKMLLAVHRRRSIKQGVNPSGVYSFIRIWVSTKNKSLMDGLRRHGKEGRTVRVVGRITEERKRSAKGAMEYTVFVEAEHLEYREGQKTKVKVAQIEDLLGMAMEPNEEELCF